MSDHSQATSPEVVRTPRPAIRWKWFPILWVGIPLVATLVLHLLDVDPGVVNSLLHGILVFGTLGVSVWLLLASPFRRGLRWTLALLASSLVLAQYAQITPWEMVIDGDVGLVGWRWRGAEPDRQLDSLETAASAALSWQTTPNDYPRFLGNGYWAEVSHVQLQTDWQAHPPQELWRKKIGAAWSAFAIVGDYAVTQEQRDEQELVTCYQVQTGKILWSHADPVRWDPRGAGALGYAGPRATPTLHAGKVLAQGATGILNCLDARTGQVLWSHDTLAKHGASNVMWGKACSPLVVGNRVVVSVGGTADQSVVAYELESGKVAWSSGKYRSSYASPVVAELAGVQQIVTVDENYVTARQASDGQPLWEFPWPSGSDSDAATSQPIPLSGDRVFVSKGYGLGSVLLQITRDEQDSWSAAPVWPEGIKTVMKTKMGNVVIHQGYVYGIDDVNLQCIELETGQKMWKQRRRPKFGHGQILLVGDTILVLTEGGELVLVEATPEKYHELASQRVLDEEQITWNNPAFAPPYLLVRNAEEAACYQLPLAAPVE